MSGDKTPWLSVVVPTLNAVATLPATLAALRADGDDRVEIIVADGGSCDGTADVAAQNHVAVIAALDTGRQHLGSDNQLAETEQKSQSELGHLPLVLNQGIDKARHEHGFLAGNSELEVHALGQDTGISHKVAQGITEGG